MVNVKNTRIGLDIVFLGLRLRIRLGLAYSFTEVTFKIPGGAPNSAGLTQGKRVQLS